MENGEFRSDFDIQITSYGLLGMLNWSCEWYDPQGRLSIQEVAEEFTALALASLAANDGPAVRASQRRRVKAASDAGRVDSPRSRA